MELRELLNRVSLPVKAKINEEEAIKNEENNISEVMTNVIIYFLEIFEFLVFPEKNKFHTIRF
jgi:hypothetical protein